MGRGSHRRVLPEGWERGAVEDDLQDWSPWSAPYVGGETEEGTPVLSPGPRRYIQFSITNQFYMIANDFDLDFKFIF